MDMSVWYLLGAVLDIFAFFAMETGFQSENAETLL